MKDIKITKSKGGINVTPQTEAAKKIFISQHKGFEDGFETDENQAHKIVAWAISHNLSVDSKVTIVIPALPFLTREQLTKVFPNIPKSFLQRKLFAVGKAKFKGDKFDTLDATKNWSVNKQFDKGIEYPVYDSEGLFVVGKDGKGYKMTQKAWTKITAY